MAKQRPPLGIQHMESKLGYKTPAYPDDEGPRFYSDLHLVPQSDYERLEREYQQSKSTKPLHLSGVLENQLHSRLPAQGTTKRIERDGESVVIYRHAHEGMYLYSVNLEFDFGLNFPFLFTEVETVRTIMVSEFSANTIITGASRFFELPLELRLKIYKFAIPQGQWFIDNMEDFDQDTLPRCLGDPSGYYFPLSRGIPLLLASKSFRQEALPIAFRHTTFRLDDMDDLAKLLLSVGRIGRANIESLHFPWESRSDLQCRWAEDNYFKLPTLHVSTSMQLLQHCSRLRRIRVLFDEEIMSHTPQNELEAKEEINRLYSKQGLVQGELLGMSGEHIKPCLLLEWPKAKMTRPRGSENHRDEVE